jgi:hypothetical protein
MDDVSFNLCEVDTLVLSGGSYYGFKLFGTIREYICTYGLCLDNVNEYYCTSVGGFIGTLLATNIDHEYLYDYFVNRPWEKHVSLGADNLLNIYSNKGALNKKLFITILKPLFDFKDINIDCTLEEFHQITNKTIHFFHTKINGFQFIDANWKTKPNMPLIDALYASCTIPYLFEPLWDGDSFLIDGALINNYPLIDSVRDACDELCEMETPTNRTILGLKFMFNDKLPTQNKNDTLLEYSFSLYGNIFAYLKNLQFTLNNSLDSYIDKLSNVHDTSYIKVYQTELNCESQSFKDAYSCLSSREFRKNLIESGRNSVSELKCLL